MSEGVFDPNVKLTDIPELKLETLSPLQVLRENTELVAFFIFIILLLGYTGYKSYNSSNIIGIKTRNPPQSVSGRGSQPGTRSQTQTRSQPGTRSRTRVQP